MQRCAEASRSWPCRLLSALIALFKDAAVLLADAVCPASQRTPQVRGVQVVHAARGKQPWSPWSMAKVCRRTCQLILRSPAFLQARHIGPLALVLLEGAAPLRAEHQFASEVPLGLECGEGVAAERELAVASARLSGAQPYDTKSDAGRLAPAS